MLDGKRPFVGWSNVHRHGWGIGWYEKGIARVEKEPAPAMESQKFVETARSAQSHLFVCHLRKATQGEYTYNNSQPFISGKWIFAHNGTVDREYLKTQLATSQRSIEGETDSEVYFHWLLQNLESGGVYGLKRGIVEARKRKFTALNFLLSDGQTVYAYWEKEQSAKAPYPDYYQLYYTELTDQNGGVAVCSERLDDSAWQAIPHRSLLVVSEKLKTQTVSVG